MKTHREEVISLDAVMDPDGRRDQAIERLAREKRQIEAVTID